MGSSQLTECKSGSMILLSVVLIILQVNQVFGEEKHTPKVIFAASNEGKFGPNPKGGYRPYVLPPEKKHGPNPKGVAGSKFVNGEERGPKPKGEAGLDGASLVQVGKMEFCKRCHGERRVS